MNWMSVVNKFYINKNDMFMQNHYMHTVHKVLIKHNCIKLSFKIKKGWKIETGILNNINFEILVF